MTDDNQSNTMNTMPATGQSVTTAVYGAPAGGGWVYLQPMPVALSPTRLETYPHKQSIGLGAAQIVLGSLCIIFNAVSLAIGLNYYYIGLGFVGHGFWCGVLFIVTGGLGISAGVSKTKCKIVSYMVLCIISACFTTGLLSCGIIGAVVTDDRRCDDYGYSTSYRYYYRPPCSVASTVIAMESCMAVSAFIAAILFIWGSALCCKAKPCCSTPYSLQQVPFAPNYTSNNGLQVIQSAQFLPPMMPYQQGVPPAYQPSVTQAVWTQPQLMQGTAVAAAVEPYPTSSSTQASGQGYVEQGNQPPPKY